MEGRSQHNSDFDAVVIGSGLGGLVCADTLASRGLRVALFEQHEFPGGYCSSFQRDGYVFDTVVDSIGGLDGRGVLGGILRRLGLLDRIEGIRLDPVRENIFGTRSILIPATLEGYREELSRHFPGDRATIRNFLDLLTRLFREIRSMSMREIFEEEVSSELRECRTLSWREFALAHVSDEIQDGMAERCCFLGLPPSKVSAISTIAMLLNYFDGGAYRIRGGYQKLADLLADDLRARGATVRLGTPVEKILIRNGAAAGVRLMSGEEISARNVVSNGDLGRTLQNLVGVEHLPTEAVSRLEGTRHSLSFLVIHLGVSLKLEGMLRSSSVGYYPGGSVERSYAYLPERLQERDLFIGVGLPTLTDPSLAPPGRHIVALHHPVPTDQFRDWKGVRERIADALVKKAERILPGLCRSIEHRSIATPVTFERYTGNRNGSAYGWEQTPDRVPAVLKLLEALPDRLFQAGHWSEYGGGTVCALVSGHEIAQKILKGESRHILGTQHVR